MITSDMQALKHVGLRTSKRIELKNADLDCKFVKYELYEGTRKIKEHKENSNTEVTSED
jgi:putative N6-adenine-specific DNA methylase